MLPHLLGIVFVRILAGKIPNRETAESEEIFLKNFNGCCQTTFQRITLIYISTVRLSVCLIPYGCTHILGVFQLFNQGPSAG